ncbi:hypothetical protein M501DRAFT_1033431 [Patellaria atrata CBS 101060]|uniref:Uncharacterized protein n=1 Tax=Patellaria atrata CBS 101060 TaxID=1346257 RepID=A0A9P4S6C0_9PEZI|nr:hypothetical protein M501DRAFT_1033431 [Patellaria atrata CBS 101060]
MAHNHLTMFQPSSDAARHRKLLRDMYANALTPSQTALIRKWVHEVEFDPEMPLPFKDVDVPSPYEHIDTLSAQRKRRVLHKYPDRVLAYQQAISSNGCDVSELCGTSSGEARERVERGYVEVQARNIGMSGGTLGASLYPVPGVLGCEIPHGVCVTVVSDGLIERRQSLCKKDILNMEMI